MVEYALRKATNMNQTVISPVNTDERKKLGIKSGDTVRVCQKIQEKDKVRLQAFEGLVLAVKHGREAGATFTVRRTTGGVGVEKIFPLYSPVIDKIEIVKRARVRRSKLYYIRDKAAREIRRQMRRALQVDISTESDEARKVREAAEADSASHEATQNEGVEESPKETTEEKKEQAPEPTEEVPKEEPKPTKENTEEKEE